MAAAAVLDQMEREGLTAKLTAHGRDQFCKKRSSRSASDEQETA